MKRIARVLITVVLLLLLCAGSFAAYTASAASNTSAEMTEIEGSVQVKRAGSEKSFKAFVRMKVDEGDTIITGTDSKAVLVYDDVEIIIPHSSVVVFSALGKSGDKETTYITIKSGGVGCKVNKKLSEGSKFEVRTPTAVMGIRGTEFYVQYRNGFLDILVGNGRVGMRYNLRRNGTLGSQAERIVERIEELIEGPNYVGLPRVGEIASRLDGRPNQERYSRFLEELALWKAFIDRFASPGKPDDGTSEIPHNEAPENNTKDSDIVYDQDDSGDDEDPGNQNFRELIIAAQSAEMPYDGSEKSLSTIEVTGLLPGHRYEGLSYTAPVGTNAGVYDGEFTGEAVIIDEASGTDVSASYDVISFLAGQLTITPKEVTVTTGSAEKEYDRTELTEGSASIEGLVAGETATVTATGSQIDAGSSSNTYNINWGNTNPANYTLTENLGTLTVSPVSSTVTVTIEGNTQTSLYDRTEQTVTGYSASSNHNLYTEADFSFSGSASACGTNAGTYPMGLSSGQFTNTNSNFMSVVFDVFDGSLEIIPISSPVTVSITGNGNAYEYNGEERTITGYTASSDNNLYTEADFTFSGSASVSGTNASTYSMGLDSGQFTNTNSNFSDVSFSIAQDGQLTINPTSTPVTVNIAGSSDTREYNGYLQTVFGYTVTAISDPLNCYAPSYISYTNPSGAQAPVVGGTNAGTYSMNLGPGNFLNNNNNYTNVTFVISADGELTISPVSSRVTVNIKGNSASREYIAGQSQTLSGYIVESISNPLYTSNCFTFSGNAVASGTNPGTYSMNLSPGNFTNNSGNFTDVAFIVEDGKLTITIPENGEIRVVLVKPIFEGVPLDSMNNITFTYTYEAENLRYKATYSDNEFEYTGYFELGAVKSGAAGGPQGGLRLDELEVTATQLPTP